MTPTHTPGVTDDKLRENRLRRAAHRQGLWLTKSRRRDPNALRYGLYALVDSETGVTMHSSAPWGIYALDLDDVEKYLLVATRPPLSPQAGPWRAPRYDFSESPGLIAV